MRDGDKYVSLGMLLLSEIIIARVATIQVEDGEGTIFGVTNGLQAFLDTGLLGALVLTIIGSLAWRIIASTFPLGFMSNPAVYLLIRVCLFLEGTGLASSTYLIAWVIKKIVKLNPDDEYLEKEDFEVELESDEEELPDEDIPDRRLALKLYKKQSTSSLGAGHMILPSSSKRLVLHSYRQRSTTLIDGQNTGSKRRLDLNSYKQVSMSTLDPGPTIGFRSPTKWPFT